MDKIKVKSITITRAEGPCALCGIKKKFASYDEANAWMLRQANTFPKCGYDKHDLQVIFEDDEEFRGRMDCKHYDCVNSDLDVREHLRNHFEWYGGLKKNPWCGMEKYQAWLANDGEESMRTHREFLEKHDV